MRLTLALTAAMLAFTSGCGGEGSGGGSGGGLPVVGGTGGDSSADLFQVSRAAAASGAVEVATEAVTNTLLDPFSHGEATGGPTTYLAPVEFEFTSHIEREIDFDAQRPNGSDRFPNISGTVLITVDGLLAGTWMAGEASYSIMIETLTDVTAVDPRSEIEVLIPEGSSWTYLLEVTWDITDAQNWIVTAVETKAIALEGLTVTDGDVVTTVGVNGGRQVTCVVAKIDGVIARERVIEGSFTITIDDGSEVTTIILEFDEEGLILVTINGDQFGPFTRQEFIEFFNAQFA